MPITDPSTIKAAEIFLDAQNELRIAGEFEDQIYSLRRRSRNYRSPLTKKQKTRIQEWSREATNHRRKAKTRMAKIVWDPKENQYRLKPKH